MTDRTVAPGTEASAVEGTALEGTAPPAPAAPAGTATEATGLARLTAFLRRDSLSSRRYRRAAAATLAHAGARVVSIITTLVSIPLTLDYLGQDRYGMWLTMLSVILVLQIADLGVGNGLLNSVARSRGREDEDAVASSVSSAVFMLSAIAAVLGVAFLVAYPFVEWADLFNVDTARARAEAGPAVLALAAVFLLSIPARAAEHVRAGFQEGYVNGAWMAVGSALSLVALLLGVWAEVGLPVLVLTVGGAPLLATLLNGAVLFLRSHPHLRPSPRRVTRAGMVALLRTGSLFFVLQIAVAVGYNADNIVAARVLGSEAVPDYAVPARLFFFGIGLVGLVLMPLWPAYGDALARDETRWVARTLRGSVLGIAAVTIPVAVASVFLGDEVVRLWVGDEIHPSTSLLAGFAAWLVLGSVGNAVAMLLNAAQVVRFQVVCSTLMAVANVGLSVVLARRWGVEGLIWGTVISYAVFVALPYAVVVPGMVRRGQY